jgi:hypothetical protein
LKACGRDEIDGIWKQQQTTSLTMSLASGPSTFAAEPLSNLTPISISKLSPHLEHLAASIINAVVTVIWPYSVSKRSITLLLAEPDFRLRRHRGQVRVQFYEAAAKAIASLKVESGDLLSLSLEGARWENRDVSVSTPGSSVEFDLAFISRLVLRIKSAANGSTKLVDIDNPSSSPLSTPNGSKVPDIASYQTPTLLPTTPVRPSLLQNGSQWSSPAFFRPTPSLSTAFKDDFNSFLDDDEAETQSNKRAKLNTQNSGWTYTRYKSDPRVVEELSSSQIQDVSPQASAGPTSQQPSNDISQQTTSFVEEDQPSSPLDLPFMAVSKSTPTDTNNFFDFGQGSSQSEGSKKLANRLMDPPPLNVKTDVGSSQVSRNLTNSFIHPISRPRLEPVSSPFLPIVSPFADSEPFGLNYIPTNDQNKSRSLPVQNDWKNHQSSNDNFSRMLHDVHSDITGDFRDREKIESNSQHSSIDLTGHSDLIPMSGLTADFGEEDQSFLQEISQTALDFQSSQGPIISWMQEGGDLLPTGAQAQDGEVEVSWLRSFPEQRTVDGGLLAETPFDQPSVNQAPSQEPLSKPHLNQSDSEQVIVSSLSYPASDEVRPDKKSTSPEPFREVVRIMTSDDEDIGNENDRPSEIIDANSTQEHSYDYKQLSQSVLADTANEHAKHRSDPQHPTLTQPLLTDTKIRDQALRSWDSTSTQILPLFSSIADEGDFPNMSNDVAHILHQALVPLPDPIDDIVNSHTEHHVQSEAVSQVINAAASKVRTVDRAEENLINRKFPAKASPQAKDKRKSPNASRASVTETDDFPLQEDIFDRQLRSLAFIPQYDGAVTSLSEFPPLKAVRSLYRKSVDILAVVIQKQGPPERARSGNRDFFLSFRIGDPSCPEGLAVLVLRPYEDALPALKTGDGILLREFQILPYKGKKTLQSTETSSWVVFTPSKTGFKETMSGPPVEYSSSERVVMTQLLKWWESPVIKHNQNASQLSPKHSFSQSVPQSQLSNLDSTIAVGLEAA